MQIAPSIRVSEAYHPAALPGTNGLFRFDPATRTAEKIDRADLRSAVR
jgi:hypothetical protein